MESIYMAFLLTTLAGLATMLGTIPIFIRLKQEHKMIAGSLAFAAGVMISISIRVTKTVIRLLSLILRIPNF